MWLICSLVGTAMFLAGIVFVFMPRRMARKPSVLMAIAGFGLMGVGGNLMPESVRQEAALARDRRASRVREQKQQEQQQLDALKGAVTAALAEAGLPAAQSIEITDGSRLVATFEIDDAALAKMVAAGITSPKEFASKAVITVRNAELPFDLVDDYRVTMNGPPPGPGLVMRYGSARFSEGSSVSWEPGAPR